MTAAEEKRLFEGDGQMAPVAVRSGPKKKKNHHDGRCWHLASVLLLLNQESMCTLTTAWHGVPCSVARELKPVPSLDYRELKGIIIC